MDEAFNQHSRRKPHPSKTPSRLSLAPLTSKLPLHDVDLEDHAPHTYLEGRSAPTTPRLLSRTASRTRLHPVSLPKSKSASHLAASHSAARKPERRHGVVSGTASPRRGGKRDEDAAAGGAAADSDWLLRTGALMTSEAREYKGQAWLVSRASSTSLATPRDPDSDPDVDEDLLEREVEREREFASRRSSRRPSVSHYHDHPRSPAAGDLRSRAHSRPGSRTPAGLERADSESYFAQRPESCEDIPGPDFIGLDEQLEALGAETAPDDEAAVRRLVRRGQTGQDSWLANVLGWSLFSVEENESEESDGGDEVDDDTETEELGAESRRSSARYLDRLGGVPEERMPPPTADEGGWKDAAWLLTVASKVIL
ncbi:uncharacterized protein DNG_06081 [Cephalotrichum gorgonifer]|uniref:DUF3984 domain-containing protein n=1 Tax=Cephalotrichum gorgonifer TaxID=2041049 RepID=A0AAE8N1K5_9PEZI|nr:uncharacterized protein DNG_06081 [Cephalotrichum gorgonifer]